VIGEDLAEAELPAVQERLALLIRLGGVVVAMGRRLIAMLSPLSLRLSP
jgi:hypothetical protein